MHLEMASRFEPLTFRAQHADIPTTRIVGCTFQRSCQVHIMKQVQWLRDSNRRPFGHNSLVYLPRVQTTRIVGCPYGEAARAFRETRCSGCEIRTADPFGHNSLVHPDHEDGWLSFWRSCTCIWCNEVQWLAGPCTSVRPRLAPCSLVNCQLQYPAFRFQACLPCAPVILF